MSTLEERFMAQVEGFMRYLRRQYHYQRRLLRDLRAYFEAKFRALLRPLYRALRAEALTDLEEELRATRWLPPEERWARRREVLTAITEASRAEARRRAWELLAEMDALTAIERRYRALEALIIPKELERLPGPLYRQASVAKSDFEDFKEREMDFLAELAERFEAIDRPEWADRCWRLVSAIERMLGRIEERWRAIPGYRVAEFAKYYQYVPPRPAPRTDWRLFELRIRITIPIWKEITDDLRRFVSIQMDNLFHHLLSMGGGAYYEDIRRRRPYERWESRWAEGPRAECWKMGVEDGLAVWDRYMPTWPWVLLDWRKLFREPTCEERRAPVYFDWEEWRYRTTGEWPEGLHDVIVSGPVVARPGAMTGYEHLRIEERELPDCPVWKGHLLAREERIGIDLDTHDPWALKMAVLRAWQFGPVEWQRTKHGYHLKIMAPWPCPEYNLAVRYMVGLGLEDPLRFRMDVLKYRAGLYCLIDTLFDQKWEGRA